MDEKQVVQVGREVHILEAGKCGVLHESGGCDGVLSHQAWRLYKTGCGCGCAINTLNSRPVIQKDLDRLEE